jgi:hypothetical protein
VKFCDAVNALKEGKKVTRQIYSNGLYFLMEDENVKSFQPVLQNYYYSEDIMISDSWLVDDDTSNEYSFSEIIPLLQSGYRARIKTWLDCYIYLDTSENTLVIHSMDSFPFMPQFNDFAAEDWMIVQ